jgi:hypothetical protein
MRFDELIVQGADPGANLGGDFTASLTERELVPKGAYLDHFRISLKGDLAATTTVAMESFLDVLQPFLFRAGQETRIQLRGRDLFALQYFLEGTTPSGFEGAAGEDDKIFGLKVPVWEKIDPKLSYTWAATRVAVTNVSGERITLSAVWSDKVLQPNPIVAVEQPFTTAAATGRTTLNINIPQVGDLIGVLIFMTTVPSATADTASIQRIQLLLGQTRASLFSVAETGIVRGGNPGISTNWAFDVLNNYRFIDLRDDPLDAKANKIGLEVDVEATSEAVRLIPVLLKK